MVLRLDLIIGGPKPQPFDSADPGSEGHCVRAQTHPKLSSLQAFSGSTVLFLACTYGLLVRTLPESPFLKPTGGLVETGAEMS